MSSAPILIAGNYCHDVIFDRTGARHCGLGGSAAYIAQILSGLGTEFEVVAKVGSDFEHTAAVLAPPIVVAGASTTSFVIRYCDDDGRVETLDAVCEPISASDIERAPGAGFAVAAACGVAFEILPETLAALKKRAPVLVADAQGLLRFKTNDGHVALRPLGETPFAETLGLIDFLKVSRSESECLDLEQACKQTNVILTDGAHGSTLFLKSGETLHSPAFEATEVDPTGAGDSFVAGFASSLSQGLTLAECLRLGNYCGALAVAQVGVPKLTPKSFERMN